MRSLLNFLLGYSLTPAGLLLLGALDASVVFFLLLPAVRHRLRRHHPDRPEA
jgi:hypothetical protein